VLNRRPQNTVPDFPGANPLGNLDVPQGARITCLTYDPALSLQIVDPSQPLFENPPALDDFNQDDIGDCYLLADLMAILSRKPADIYGIFKDLGNGKIIVRIFAPDGTPQFFEVPRANPLGKFNPKNAEWIRTLEAVYGAFHTGSAVISEKTYTAICGGDDAPATLFPKDPPRQLIGHSSTNFWMSQLWKEHQFKIKKPGEYSLTAILFYEKLSLLHRCFNSAITATTPRDTSSRSKIESLGLVPHHVYCVLGLSVDKTAAGKKLYTVEIENPWGCRVPVHLFNKFSDTWTLRASGGERGAERGPGGNHGRFSMDIVEFMACFESIHHDVCEETVVKTEDFSIAVCGLISQLAVIDANSLDQEQTAKFILNKLENIVYILNSYSRRCLGRELSREEKIIEFRKVLDVIAMTRER